MPPVVSRSRSDFGQIHCLPSRAANAFESGQFCLVLRFWRLAEPITYLFPLPLNIPKHLAINQVKSAWQRSDSQILYGFLPSSSPLGGTTMPDYILFWSSLFR
jgi:hypothetical protein